MSISKTAVKNIKQLLVDQLVVIVLKGINIMIPNGEEEMAVSAMLSGILSDVDQDNVYITDEFGSVKVVPHDSIGVLELAEHQDELLTDQFPQDGDEVH